MQFKPFKPPRPLTGFNSLNNRHEPIFVDDEPPAKKRRINQGDSDEDEEEAHRAKPTKSKPKPRAPLAVVKNPFLGTLQSSSPPVPSPASQQGQETSRYYRVLWRKITNKKHKTWDGDGFLSESGGYAFLKDENGKDMGRTACKTALLSGSILSISGKEVEIDSLLSRKDYLAIVQPGGSHSQPIREAPIREVPTPRSLHKPLPKPMVKSQPAPVVLARKEQADPLSSDFKSPMLKNNVQAKTENKIPVPRHDPSAKGSLVMTRPKQASKGQQLVDVVVDPIVSKHLRDHQREGVRFMYECVMGLRPFEGEGAILADEMGLGKSLQTIALLWTLLKQNPIYEERPVIKKALIVCPVTLVNNWRQEFRKWLGNERIGVMVADEKARLSDFTKGRTYNVMIIGYEKLRLVQKELQRGAGIDIVIADEGHRLKTAKNKSAEAIKSLNTERRIILSGTPIQNDLGEFFTMVDFVNPGLLGKYATFKRNFEIPIIKSRQPEATQEELDQGKEQSEELASITAQFILRRTSDVLAKYLPPKTEYVVFCRPTKGQVAVYNALLSGSAIGTALNNSAMSLALINVLKKVCNSPKLLLQKANEKSDELETTGAASWIEQIPAKKLEAASSKIMTLDLLLEHIRNQTSDKVVLVSNYTATLDALQGLLAAYEYRFLRLDGSTPASKRQDLVNEFNRATPDRCFVFLLSAKAGGQGLNLIGANRLVLFDLDWNPSVDAQAMARICRDGQKKPCFIYRLITKGALDEKIFQRQMTKTGLSESIVDSKSSVNSFSQDILRDLFTLDQRESCQSHDLIECDCDQRGSPHEVAVSLEEPTREPSPAVSDGDQSLPDVSELTERASMPAFMTASQVERQEQDGDFGATSRSRSASPEKKGRMRGLLQYMHFDATAIRQKPDAAPKAKPEIVEIDGEDVDDELTDQHEPIEEETEIADGDVLKNELESAIQDAALRAVIMADTSHVDFVFTKAGS